MIGILFATFAIPNYKIRGMVSQCTIMIMLIDLYISTKGMWKLLPKFGNISLNALVIQNMAMYFLATFFPLLYAEDTRSLLFDNSLIVKLQFLFMLANFTLWFTSILILDNEVLVVRLKQANDEMKKMAYVDTLTKLYSRNFMEVELEHAFANAKRYNYPYSIILIDVDHYKVINDTFGHAVGDEVLAGIASIMKSHIRESDLLCRWGGDEFLLVMPHTTIDKAVTVAEKIRTFVETAQFNSTTVTVSGGIASFHPAIGKIELIKQADQALYIAKNSGRNQFVCYSEAYHASDDPVNNEA